MSFLKSGIVRRIKESIKRFITYLFMGIISGVHTSLLYHGGAEVCYLPFGNLKGYIKKEIVLIKFMVLLKTGITHFC